LLPIFSLICGLKDATAAVLLTRDHLKLKSRDLPHYSQVTSNMMHKNSYANCWKVCTKMLIVLWLNQNPSLKILTMS
ncbi:hypothetical protein SK128_018181, partial [Halocaridina rubra]